MSAEKYYKSKKWGNPMWDRNCAAQFDKSEMFDFAEAFHQHKLSEVSEEELKKEAKRMKEEYVDKFQGTVHMVHRMATKWLLNKLKQ